MLLKCFQAARQADPYSPTAPTLIARRFDENRQIPEARVRQMLEAVVTSPLVPRVAKLIEQRLQRKLEPFDVWYAGWPRGGTEEQLDAIVKARYQPRGLQSIRTCSTGRLLEERAQYLASHIEWISPGLGHALEPRGAAITRTCTRAEKDGMTTRLQHRRPRDGPQRGADLFLERRGLDAAPGFPHRLPEALARLSGPRSGAVGSLKPDAGEGRNVNAFWEPTRSRCRPGGRLWH
jgi:hypothetical protein